MLRRELRAVHESSYRIPLALLFVFAWDVAHPLDYSCFDFSLTSSSFCICFTCSVMGGSVLFALVCIFPQQSASRISV